MSLKNQKPRISKKDDEYFGETFNIGGNNEMNNISLVRKICKVF